MEGVVGVVLGFDLGEPSVDLVAIGLSNPAGVVVGIEKVDVYTGDAVRLECLEKPTYPGGLDRGVLGSLLRQPHAVDDDVVGHIPTGKGGGVAGNAGDGPTQVEYRRVRPRRPRGVGLFGDDGDRLVREAGMTGGLPVVVPAVENGVVERALEGGVRAGREQVHQRFT